MFMIFIYHLEFALRFCPVLPFVVRTVNPIKNRRNLFFTPDKKKLDLDRMCLRLSSCTSDGRSGLLFSGSSQNVR